MPVKESGKLLKLHSPGIICCVSHSEYDNHLNIHIPASPVSTSFTKQNSATWPSSCHHSPYTQFKMSKRRNCTDLALSKYTPGPVEVFWVQDAQAHKKDDYGAKDGQAIHFNQTSDYNRVLLPVARSVVVRLLTVSIMFNVVLSMFVFSSVAWSDKNKEIEPKEQHRDHHRQRDGIDDMKGLGILCSHYPISCWVVIVRGCFFSAPIITS